MSFTYYDNGAVLRTQGDTLALWCSPRYRPSLTVTDGNSDDEPEVTVFLGTDPADAAANLEALAAHLRAIDNRNKETQP